MTYFTKRDTFLETRGEKVGVLTTDTPLMRLDEGQNADYGKSYLITEGGLKSHIVVLADSEVTSKEEQWEITLNKEETN